MARDWARAGLARALWKFNSGLKVTRREPGGGAGFARHRNNGMIAASACSSKKPQFVHPIEITERKTP